MSRLQNNKITVYWFIFLMAFGILLLLGGSFAAWQMWSKIFEHLALRSWVETPAQILRTEKEENEMLGRSQTHADYEYQFRGGKYRGFRVSLYQGFDSGIKFQDRIFQELQGFQSSGQPFRCFVNPRRPSESILYPQLCFESILFSEIVLLVCGVLGLGMITTSRYEWRKRSEHDLLSAKYPGQPWLWRADWAANEILPNDHEKTRSIMLALFINPATVPIWWLFLQENFGREPFWVLAPIFPAIGMWLGARAVSLLWIQYLLGRCRFRMTTIPGEIGGKLEGNIQTEHRVAGEQVVLRLDCTEWNCRGEDATSKEIWRAEQPVANTLEVLVGRKRGSIIPVSFDIPESCLATLEPCDKDDGHEIRWTLALISRESAYSFHLKFEVPVFLRPEIER